jgi:hypothetical protein
MINNFPRKWDNIMVLPATQSIFYGWIPALRAAASRLACLPLCAGMTA